MAAEVRAVDLIAVNQPYMVKGGVNPPPTFVRTAQKIVC